MIQYFINIIRYDMISNVDNTGCNLNDSDDEDHDIQNLLVYFFK